MDVKLTTEKFNVYAKYLIYCEFFMLSNIIKQNQERLRLVVVRKTHRTQSLIADFANILRIFIIFLAIYLH